MTSHRIDWQDDGPASCRAGAVAVGNFDGAHLGHAALIRELIQHARAFAGPAVVVTFDPHPLTLLRPDIPVVLLTTPADKAEALHALGADHVLTLSVTPELLALRARAFFDLVIRERLDARAMVEGANFHFGHDREGDITLLGQLCREAGLRLSIVEPIVVDGVEVSSSRIRMELVKGAVESARTLLGRPYQLRGVVVEGQRRGRTIGFPTANLERVRTVCPGQGVYAVQVRTEGRTWSGAANIGPNPTFAEETFKIEVHLIGFHGELYGKEVEVAFLARIRDTRRFSAVGDLVEQLRRDVEQARAIVSTQGAGVQG
jgi:riboflavin kinase/FMN adenylyltransferase